MKKKASDSSSGDDNRNTKKRRRTLRWGILSTASIGNKFIRTLRDRLDPHDGEVVAIGSRDLASAQNFGKEYGIRKCYGSYQEVLDDPEIDCIYIPLPSSMHCEWTIRSAQKGKHVLCEKPLAATAEEAKKMFAACQENGVLLMDGVMWTHHHRTHKIKSTLASGKIGTLSSFYSYFSWPHIKSFPNNIRFKKELEPLGCLGDLGWYSVRALLHCFGESQLPQRVYGTGKWSHERLGTAGKDNQKEAEDDTYKVPIEFTGLIWYADGRTAEIKCSFEIPTHQLFEVYGTKGVLSCRDFVQPYDERGRFFVNTDQEPPKGKEEKARDLLKMEEIEGDKESCQEANMLDTFQREVLRWDEERQNFSPATKTKESLAARVRANPVSEEWRHLALNTQLICSALFESFLKGEPITL